MGYEEDKKNYDGELKRLKAFFDETLWDGAWFIRGITKNGKKIGSSANREGKIHLESNAWAVLSGAAKEDKARTTLDSIHEYLATPYGILLNAPAYTEPDDDIGFVTRVYPGLKENSSIFSHPNPWVWSAECTVGNGDRAFEYYRSLCPYYQNDMIEIRHAEPYSYCQFISGRDHTAFGEAHHPFLTGSGGWSYFAVTHYLLGIRPGFDELTVDPCIPAKWEGFSVRRNFRGDIFDITVENPGHVQKGVKEIYVDGKAADRIACPMDGREHSVRIVMG